jgi:hypothetical protein
MLQLSKRRLTFLFENLADGFARARFDYSVRIKKREVQCVSHNTANCGFARPHKPDQSEVFNFAGDEHENEYPILRSFARSFSARERRSAGPYLL